MKSKGYFYHLEYGKSYKVFAEVISTNGSNSASSEVFSIPELMGIYYRNNGEWHKVDAYTYGGGEFKGLYLYERINNEWKKFSNRKIEEVE